LSRPKSAVVFAALFARDAREEEDGRRRRSASVAGRPSALGSRRARIVARRRVARCRRESVSPTRDESLVGFL